MITFFSVSYLILRAMLERLNPALEEAAESMRASRFHIFRTVTLPLLVPGIAGAFLLLFVESLADLGNPRFISGNVTVLSAQIYLAVIGEYDYQKASALSLVLLLPTLIVFLVQRYYVNRRSYISVTGKPVGGQLMEKDPIIRWGFNIVVYIVCAFIILLYATIIYGSFSTAWGVDFTPTLRWWEHTVTRGVEAILDTTFLSVLATPVAALTGMVIAFLVVRKKFSGKEVLDFGSNMGGAVPGTILGIGFVLAFSTPPKIVVAIMFGLLALFFARFVYKARRKQILVFVLGSAIGIGLSFLDGPLALEGLYYLLGGIYIAAGAFTWFVNKQPKNGKIFMALGVYLFMYDLVYYLAQPLAAFSRTLERGFWSNAIFSSRLPEGCSSRSPRLSWRSFSPLWGWCPRFCEGEGETAACHRLPCHSGCADLHRFALALPAPRLSSWRRLPCAACRFVRAGVAALQQIDPSLEKPPTAWAQTRSILPQGDAAAHLPALLAGLIFSFTRHMTSLSAIIFLVSARWRIVTASILSEWERAGEYCSWYSTVIIVFVLLAIGLLYLITIKC